MEQKIMWMRYLLFGISAIIIFFSFSCERTKDYSVKSKWIFINETNHEITFEPLGFWDKFNVSENDTTIYIEDGEGSKTVSIEDFVPPINAQVVIINEIICDTALAHKLHDINSYSGVKNAERDFQFTFRFTDSNMNLKDTCK